MKIEKSTYTGYLWYSDEKEPQILQGKEFELEIAENKNPFIIEGKLYDGKKSISIKYVDGKYLMNTYEVKQEDLKETNPNIVQKEYIANFDGVGKLVFLQYWRPVVDALCEGMNVLQPQELVFIGFDNKKEE